MEIFYLVCFILAILCAVVGVALVFSCTIHFRTARLESQTSSLLEELFLDFIGSYILLLRDLWSALSSSEGRLKHRQEVRLLIWGIAFLILSVPFWKMSIGFWRQ